MNEISYEEFIHYLQIGQPFTARVKGLGEVNLKVVPQTRLMPQQEHSIALQTVLVVNGRYVSVSEFDDYIDNNIGIIGRIISKLIYGLNRTNKTNSKPEDIPTQKDTKSKTGRREQGGYHLTSKDGLAGNADKLPLGGRAIIFNIEVLFAVLNVLGFAPKFPHNSNFYNLPTGADNVKDIIIENDLFKKEETIYFTPKLETKKCEGGEFRYLVTQHEGLHRYQLNYEERAGLKNFTYEGYFKKEDTLSRSFYGENRVSGVHLKYNVVKKISPNE